MKGKILDFSLQENQGAISTDDGKRYKFQSSAWRESGIPIRGNLIDFDIDENGMAIDIYLADEDRGTKLSSGYTGPQSSKGMAQSPKGAAYYLYVLKNYALFKGRARRSEYWFFQLIDTLILLPLVIIDLSLFEGFFLLSSLYSLATLVPTIAVSVRRFHDTGRSGLWYLISLVPFVGTIVVFVFMCIDSSVGENEYGENPKGIN